MLSRDFVTQPYYPLLFPSVILFLSFLTIFLFFSLFCPSPFRPLPSLSPSLPLHFHPFPFPSLFAHRRLQSVLNAAARLIYHLRSRDHMTDALISLHWLRVPEQIQ